MVTILFEAELQNRSHVLMDARCVTSMVYSRVREWTQQLDTFWS